MAGLGDAMKGAIGRRMAAAKAEADKPKAPAKPKPKADPDEWRPTIDATEITGTN